MPSGFLELELLAGAGVAGAFDAALVELVGAGRAAGCGWLVSAGAVFEEAGGAVVAELGAGAVEVGVGVAAGVGVGLGAGVVEVPAEPEPLPVPVPPLFEEPPPIKVIPPINIECSPPSFSN